MSFFSNASYLYLPVTKNPRVALAVDNFSIARNSYKLYNPFSLKGKIIKWGSFCVLPFLRVLGILKKEKKSEFIEYLEQIFQKKIISSLYYSTDRDKIVLQLQDYYDNKIIGYCKIGLTKRGVNRLKNEVNALKFLSKRVGNIYFPNLVFEGRYNDLYFSVYGNVDGKPVYLSIGELKKILRYLEKNRFYTLDTHPTVTELFQFFYERNLFEFVDIIRKFICCKEYLVREVYCHGDFAPWNILKVSDKLYIIDWEYYEEKCLEGVDLIKYYYQVNSLIKRLDGLRLINKIKSQTALDNFKEIFVIFLLREIKTKIVDGRNFSKERKLLDLVVTRRD